MDSGRWITINGTHVFVKDGQSPMDAYVRKFSKKMTKQQYIFNKEQQQQPLGQAFGIVPKQEKFRYKAERLLQQANKRKNKGGKQ